MKNLSDLIKENNDNKTYKYVAEVTIEGTVTASSEVDAGEAVDKEIDEIVGVTNYEMKSLDEVEAGDVVESTLNDNSQHIEEIYNAVIDTYEELVPILTSTQAAIELKMKLSQYFNNL